MVTLLRHWSIRTRLSLNDTSRLPVSLGINRFEWRLTSVICRLSVRHSTWYTVDSCALPLSMARNTGRTHDLSADDRHFSVVSLVRICSGVATAVR